MGGWDPSEQGGGSYGVSGSAKAGRKSPACFCDSGLGGQSHSSLEVTAAAGRGSRGHRGAQCVCVDVSGGADAKPLPQGRASAGSCLWDGCEVTDEVRYPKCPPRWLEEVVHSLGGLRAVFAVSKGF